MMLMSEARRERAESSSEVMLYGDDGAETTVRAITSGDLATETTEDFSGFIGTFKTFCDVAVATVFVLIFSFLIGNVSSGRVRGDRTIPDNEGVVVAT